MELYTEMLVRGDESDLKAYLFGHASGSQALRVVYADEAGFHIQELRERIKHHGEVVHVIVNSAHAPRVRSAIETAGKRYAFVVVGERTLERVRFAFDFDTPSPDVAARIKALLKEPPSGVVVEGAVPREHHIANASTTELYAPEHHYQFTGRGIARGDVFAVIDFRDALRAIDFVRCDEIVVDGPA